MNDELRRFVDLIDARQSSDAEAWAMGRAKDGDADGEFLMGYLLFWRVDYRTHLLGSKEGAQRNVIGL